MNTAVTFIAGVSAALSFVAAAFFLRFWRLGKDRFFFLFGLAFAVFGANRIALTIVPEEHDLWIFLLRFAAFGLILTAIADKNRSR